MSRAVMQQALEALCFGLHVGFDESSESRIKKGSVAFDHHIKAITALRERLAQSEQEPVAWMQNTTAGLYVIDHYDEWHCIPLYASPPQRICPTCEALARTVMLDHVFHDRVTKPLTDEQREEIAKGWRGRTWTVGDIIDAIEAAHGIRGEA